MVKSIRIILVVVNFSDARLRVALVRLEFKKLGGRNKCRLVRC